MQKFTGVEFSQKPAEVEVYKSGVDVFTSRVETKKTDEQTGEERTVWVCDVERYSLQEYIYVQQNKFNDEVGAVQNELAQTQLAITEVYELLLGDGL